MISTTKIESNPVAILRSHAANVSTVGYLNNNRLFSGDSNGVIKLWDLESRRVQQEIVSAHNDAAILHVEPVTPNDHNILSQGRDGTIKVWDLNATSSPTNEISTGSYTFCKFALPRQSNYQWKGFEREKQIHEENKQGEDILDPQKVAKIEEENIIFQDGEQEVSHETLPFSNIMCVSPSDKQSMIHVWDVREQKPVFELLPENDDDHGMLMSLQIHSFSASIEDSYVIGGFEGGQLAFFDLRKGNHMCLSSKLHDEPVLSFDIGSNCTKGVSGSAGSHVNAFKLNLFKLKLKVIKVFDKNFPGTNALQIRPDQKILVSAGWDHRIRLYSWKNLEQLAVLRCHQESVNSIAFCPNAGSGRFASCSKDGRIALWDLYGNNTS